MKLKDFITHLQQFDPELEVVGSTTDPTDYTYKVALDEDSISLGDPYDSNGGSAFEDDEDDSSNWDEEYKYNCIGPKVLIIDLGLIQEYRII